jgi:hypothetical protein
VKFTSARCELCGRYCFKPEEVVAFRRVMQGEIEEVDMHDEQPWAGVRCICRECVEFVKAHPGQVHLRHQAEEPPAFDITKVCRKCKSGTYQLAGTPNWQNRVKCDKCGHLMIT